MLGKLLKIRVALGLNPSCDAAEPNLCAELPDFAPAAQRVSIGREFCQNGFVIAPKIFTPEEIAAFRSHALRILPPNQPPYKSQFIAQAPFTEKLFRETIFKNAQFIAAFRELLGDDFTFVNEAGLHDSFHAGWHSGTTSPEAKGGHEFHWSPEFSLINAAIYLQDNNGGGGGLDAVPGSYVRDDPYAISLRRKNNFPPSHRIAEDAGNPYRDAVTLRARAGDVVFFHLRTWHRSSVPTEPAVDDSRRKLAFFLLAGRNNALTRRYCVWLDEYAQAEGTPRAGLDPEFISFMSSLGLTVI